MLKNAIAYAEICGICANICKFLDMRHNFRICDFENAIICRKICDMRVLAKYAIAYNQHLYSMPFGIINTTDYTHLFLQLNAMQRLLLACQIISV